MNVSENGRNGAGFELENNFIVVANTQAFIKVAN